MAKCKPRPTVPNHHRFTIGCNTKAACFLDVERTPNPSGIDDEPHNDIDLDLDLLNPIRPLYSLFRQPGAYQTIKM